MALGLTKLNNQVVESAEVVATGGAIEWASDTGGSPIQAGAAEWFHSVNIQVSVTFDASATEGAIVHARKSADSGTTEDTEGTYLGTIPVSAGATVVKTFDVYDFAFLDIGIANEDATYTLTWSAIYTGVKQTGMGTS